MNKHLRGLGLAIVGAGLFSGAVSAQTAPPIPPASIPGQSAPESPASNPVCVRLEGQLAILTRGGGDPGRADQIRRSEDAVAKQQTDLDRMLAQAKRRGCEGGFFSLFTGQSAECQPLNAQIQQMRDNLDRSMNDLERFKSGNNSDQEGQRRQLIGALAQNNCGQQYRAAAEAAGPAGFFDALFNGRIINPVGEGAPFGTFRTVCVRTCDGYYFPISYSTVPSKFADDERLCQRLCPASEAVLYSHRNPGEDVTRAVAASGRSYSELPTAFAYRKAFNNACSCRAPGQSWEDALKQLDDQTVERGDIVVQTEEQAKPLSQPRLDAQAKPIRLEATPGRAPAPNARNPNPSMPRGANATAVQ